MNRYATNGPGGPFNSEEEPQVKKQIDYRPAIIGSAALLGAAYAAGKVSKNRNGEILKRANAIVQQNHKLKGEILKSKAANKVARPTGVQSPLHQALLKKEPQQIGPKFHVTEGGTIGSTNFKSARPNSRVIGGGKTGTGRDFTGDRVLPSEIARNPKPYADDQKLPISTGRAWNDDLLGGDLETVGRSRNRGLLTPEARGILVAARERMTGKVVTPPPPKRGQKQRGAGIEERPSDIIAPELKVVKKPNPPGHMGSFKHHVPQDREQIYVRPKTNRVLVAPVKREGGSEAPFRIAAQKFTQKRKQWRFDHTDPRTGRLTWTTDKHGNQKPRESPYQNYKYDPSVSTFVAQKVTKARAKAKAKQADKKKKFLERMVRLVQLETRQVQRDQNGSFKQSPMGGGEQPMSPNDMQNAYQKPTMKKLMVGAATGVGLVAGVAAMRGKGGRSVAEIFRDQGTKMAKQAAEKDATSALAGSFVKKGFARRAKSRFEQEQVNNYLYAKGAKATEKGKAAVLSSDRTKKAWEKRLGFEQERHVSKVLQRKAQRDTIWSELREKRAAAGLPDPAPGSKPMGWERQVGNKVRENFNPPAPKSTVDAIQRAADQRVAAGMAEQRAVFDAKLAQLKTNTATSGSTAGASVAPQLKAAQAENKALKQRLDEMGKQGEVNQAAADKLIKKEHNAARSRYRDVRKAPHEVGPAVRDADGNPIWEGTGVKMENGVPKLSKHGEVIPVQQTHVQAWNPLNPREPLEARRVVQDDMFNKVQAEDFVPAEQKIRMDQMVKKIIDQQGGKWGLKPGQQPNANDLAQIEAIAQDLIGSSKLVPKPGLVENLAPKGAKLNVSKEGAPKDLFPGFKSKPAQSATKEDIEKQIKELTDAARFKRANKTADIEQQTKALLKQIDDSKMSRADIQKAKKELRKLLAKGEIKLLPRGLDGVDGGPVPGVIPGLLSARQRHTIELIRKQKRLITLTR